jgi:hypothetical protein
MFARNSQSKLPSPLRNWEEWRGTTFLLPCFPLELVQEQVPQPRHGYFVDIMVDARERLPASLEPLRRFVAGRRIVIELESGQISASKFRRHLAQPLLVPPPDDPDEAVLLIICRHPPRARLGYHEAVLLEPGIWQIPRGRRGAAYVIVPGLLTRSPGYALLRGSFVSRNKAEANERMDHFLTDPLLPSVVREALMGQIARKEVPMSDEELDALYEEYRRLPPSPYRDHLVRCAKRQGRKEGRQEGRQEGEEKGEARTLLAIASRLMSPVEVERLSTLTLDALRELVERELAALTSNRSSDGAR